MQSQWGPINTPSTIKHLIIWTCVIAILSAILQSIFEQFGFTPGPLQLLSLSWWGISNLYLWQPLTFLFVQPYSSAGVTFFSLISLFFSMYMLWILGTAILELVGKGAFLRFYFICGIAAGLAALFIMPLTGKYAMLAGSTPALLALLTAWSMAYPETEVLLFFLIPVKAKWIMAGLTGAMLLIAFSQWDIGSFFLYLASILFGYMYACVAWGWHSPFSFTGPLDSALATLGLRLRRFHIGSKWIPFNRKDTKESLDRDAKNKVIDIGTGAPQMSDEVFIDQMLAKISQYGERSLSWSERRRMQQISEKKRKDHDEGNK